MQLQVVHLGIQGNSWLHKGWEGLKSALPGQWS